jgi:beta-lactam-binding protein with PASTA domain
MLKFITHRPLWLNILTGLLLALAIFFIFIFSLNWITHHNESKTVPSVVGKSYDEAKKILEKAGFEIEIQDSIYVDTAQPMRVVKQIPESEEIVKIDRTVYVTINRAVPPMVDIPSIVGYSFRSAEMEMKNRGIRVDTVYKRDFAWNSVLEVRYNGEIIKPGEKIRMGSRVLFVLGNGNGDEKFIVPALVGMTFGQAKIRLEANGIGIGSVILNPDVTDTLRAFIFKQDPERLGAENKFNYIRSGQLMNVWLQLEKPIIDSSNNPLPN